MSESEIRRIVRDEMASILADRDAVNAARSSQLAARFREQILARNAPNDGDGPLVGQIKAILRGEQ